MDWDRIILKLVGGFVVLLTALTVLLAGSAIAANAFSDAGGGRFLMRVAVGALMLLVVDAILLLLAVAIRSIEKPKD